MSTDSERHPYHPSHASDDVREVPEPAPSGSAAPAGDETPSGYGDPRIDEVMARLASVAERPAAEQVAEYEAVHRVLQDTLATIDDA